MIQIRNNYDKGAAGVFNGTVGTITALSVTDQQLTVRTDEDEDIDYDFDELDELQHAYAITVHRSQGSEYPAVVVRLLRAFTLLQRNLIYTAITRGPSAWSCWPAAARPWPSRCAPPAPAAATPHSPTACRNPATPPADPRGWPESAWNHSRGLPGRDPSACPRTQPSDGGPVSAEVAAHVGLPCAFRAWYSCRYRGPMSCAIRAAADDSEQSWPGAAGCTCVRLHELTAAGPRPRGSRTPDPDDLSRPGWLALLGAVAALGRCHGSRSCQDLEDGRSAVGGDPAAHVAVHGDRWPGVAELVGDLASGREAAGVEDACCRFAEHMAGGPAESGVLEGVSQVGGRARAFCARPRRRQRGVESSGYRSGRSRCCGSAPEPVSVGTAVRLVMQHCEHLGIDGDEMDELLGGCDR